VVRGRGQGRPGNRALECAPRLVPSTVGGKRRTLLDRHLARSGHQHIEFT
jgi:hypothetical protein